MMSVMVEMAASSSLESANPVQAVPTAAADPDGAGDYDGWRRM